MLGNSFESNETKFCGGLLNKKQLVAVAGCSDDLAAVSALPETWTPKKGGSILSNYLKERESNFKEVLNTLTNEAHIVNNDIDLKVRKLAEILLSDTQQNQNEIQCVIGNQEGKCPLSKEERDISLKQIAKLALERIQVLTKFKQDSLGLERQRADGLRKVLKYKFQRLINVGHKPPKVLLHDFDERIYDINQQLLSNSRAYIELEAQLRLQLDENIIHARSRVNQLCLDDPKTLRFLNHSPRFVEKKSSQKFSNSTGVINNQVSVNRKLLKETLSNILQIYKDTCDKILNDFSDQLDRVLKKYTTNETSCDNIEVLYLNKFLDNDLINNLKSAELDIKDKKFEKIINNDLINLEKQLLSLTKQLHDMYLTLTNTFDLCDKYLNRFYLGQKLITASIDDMQTGHDAIELSNEVIYNIALEQMRNASDNDKLQQLFDYVTNSLNKISESYCQHKETEIAKIEDFVFISSIMSHVVLSEIHIFQINNPKFPTHIKSPSTTTEYEYTKEILSLRAPMLEAALQIELQSQEVGEYKNTYLDSIEYNLNLIPDCLAQQTRQWVHHKRELLDMRNSLKYLSHSIRSERVKAAYDLRFSELRYHETILNSHLEAMYDIIDKMPLEASEYLAINAPELYPFCKWISDIKTDIDRLNTQEPIEPEFKWLKMNSFSHRLVKHRQRFEESLILAIEGHKRDLEYTVQRARISNVNLLSHIKLFFEDGRYASTEATKSSIALVKAGDALESAFNRTLDVLQHRRSQLLGLADQQILPLQRIVEDSLKYGARYVSDKRVFASNKKK